MKITEDKLRKIIREELNEAEFETEPNQRLASILRNLLPQSRIEYVEGGVILNVGRQSFVINSSDYKVAEDGEAAQLLQRILRNQMR